MKRILIGTALAVSTLIGAGTSSVSASGTFDVPDDVAESITNAKSAVYIVMMDADPAVTYRGGLAGFAATAPAEGAKIDRRNRNVQRYVGRLHSDQDAALRRVGVAPARKLVTYTYAANGFAVKLSDTQAANLRKQPGVRMVVEDSIRKVQTDSSGSFLGLNADHGPWESKLTGENVVVGVIDTGIWPEHPSFADNGKYKPLPAGEFTGTGCDFGNVAVNPLDAPFTCNQKLLAAKSYGAVFHANDPANLVPGSYLSARDEDGHGTHTASTAAGNGRVSASVLGADYGRVSGVAPRARVSVYKACWNGDEGGCSNGDLVAAIDAAVADGVDVINYSIGSDTAAFSPDSLAFLFANDAGVFVSASAGNAGPGEATVGSPVAASPWVTAVGASTQKRDFRGTVTLGDGQVFEGVSITGGAGPAPFVNAETLGNRLCLTDVGFPAGSVTGAIVLCARGTNARVEKSQSVSAGGGVGMVLYNPTPNTRNTDNHYVPAMHVDATAGAASAAYIASAGASATVTLSGGQKVNGNPNQMADFSSRGSNLFTPDLITPDVTAPGVNILAGNTPTPLLGAPGQLFQAISGTSMSSPHVAGTLALLKQGHPEWSPAAAKSALMTTARQNVTKEDGVTPADPFDFGAGHIKPGGDVRKKNSMFNPGLVYDAGFFDYLGYLCEPGLLDQLAGDGSCQFLADNGVPTTVENLNVASIGVSDVTGAATVTRTVTNVSGKRISWEAKVKAPAGFKVSVSPRKMRLDAGASASFTVTFTRTTAPFGTWAFGSLTWEGSDYKVRSPIAVKPQQLSAPAAATGSGAAGTLDIPVAFGYAGVYTADAHGLVAANEQVSSVVDDPTNDVATALGTGVGISIHEVVVPAGTAISRIALFDDAVDGPHDLDLYVFDADFNFVGGSGSGTSNEVVDLVLPAGGTYFAIVHAFEAAGGTANYTLFDWSVPVADGAGSLTITAAPTAATLAGTGTVSAAWSGLTAGTRYLGAVSHSNDAELLALTVVDITG